MKLKVLALALLTGGFAGAAVAQQPETSVIQDPTQPGLMNLDRYNKIRKQQGQAAQQAQKEFIKAPWKLGNPVIEGRYAYADTATWQYSNEYGQVYSLPGDNMPLLKPNITGIMPGAMATPAPLPPNNQPGQMPNARGRTLVIPAPGVPKK
ncbi:MAG TPA: hypothetical protein PKD90_09070 [Phnomibacter sp.]|nr:hypothetical protein [Phnomibacter sp.]